MTIAFNFVTWRAFSFDTAMYVRQFPAWRLLVWIPLYIGAFLTGWGSFYTAPGALDRPSASRSKISAKGALPWPTIVNLACLGTPFVLIASLIPPVVLASRQFALAFHEYERWSASVNDVLAQAVGAEAISSSVMDSFATQARTVWHSCSKSYWYIDIGFTLWSFWALFFLFFYIPAGGTLVYLILRQVLHHKAALVSYQRKLDEHVQRQEKEQQMLQTPILSKLEGQQQGLGISNAHRHRPQSAESVATGKTVESGKASREFVGLTAALQQFAPDSYQLQTEARSPSDSPTNPVRELSCNAVSQDGQAPVSERPISALKRLIRKESVTNRKLLSPRKSKDSKQKLTGNGPMVRYQYLRRCLVNLMILYFGIIAAACLFLVCTLRLAIYEYEASLRDPDALADGMYVAGNLAAWASAVFGGLTVGSIIFRNFDQSAPETNEDSKEGAPKRHPAQQAKDPEDVDEKSGTAIPVAFASPAGQIHSSRTLPAVPESVGVDTSMMSFQRSRQDTQAGTRFMQATSTDRLGPFLLHPDDHSTSLLSGAYPDVEAAIGAPTPTGSTRGRFGIRSRPTTVAPLRVVVDREPTTSLPQDETESYGIISMIPRDDVAQPVEELNPIEEIGYASVTYDSTLVPIATIDEVAKIRSPLTRAHSDGDFAIAKPPSASEARLSRQSDKRPDTPASKIAREWALSQRVATSAPTTPTVAAYEYGSQGHGSTVGSPQQRFSPGTFF